MVANAYLIYTTRLIVGQTKISERYAVDADRLLLLFREDYITPKGRLACDTQTSYALGLKFGLFEEDQRDVARKRLGHLVGWDRFNITTGFAGTPIILQVLADNGMLNLAYRMLQERDCPSWLYPVRMGATTIWERWNSMLEDGSINPGQMTSFNHISLGSVCSFLHNVVGGLGHIAPGWREALIKPQPGGTVRSARTAFDSPYGPFEVDWKIEEREGKMVTKVKVPPNEEAQVVLRGVDETVGSGEYIFETDWQDDPEWPPACVPGPQRNMSKVTLFLSK